MSTQITPQTLASTTQRNSTSAGPPTYLPFLWRPAAGPKPFHAQCPPPPCSRDPWRVCVCVLFVYMHVTACTASPQALQRQTLMQMLFSLSPACIIEPLFFFRQGTSTLDSPVELHSFVQDRIEFSRWFPVQSIFFLRHTSHRLLIRLILFSYLFWNFLTAYFSEASNFVQFLLQVALSQKKMMAWGSFIHSTKWQRLGLACARLGDDRPLQHG